MGVLAVGSGGSANSRAREGWCASRALWLVMLAAVLAAAPWSVYRASVNGGSDFPEFREAGAFALQNGTRHPRSALYRYLPSLDVACIPLTWLPVELSASLWYALNAACWFGFLKIVRDDLLADCDSKFAREVTLAAGLVGLPLAIDGFLLGGFHALMLWLMAAGLLRVLRGNERSGGMLLGAAVWLKLLPIFGISYLVLKRKWKPAVVALVTALVIDVGLSLPVYGWRETCALHGDWFWCDAIGTGDRQLAGQTNDDEDRITNQSLMAVLRRFLTDRGGFPQLSLARFNETELTFVVLCVLAGLGMGALRLLRFQEVGAGVALNAPDVGGRRAPCRKFVGEQISLVCLCTVWFSPVVWSYHLIAAVPATAVALARRSRARDRWAIIGIWCGGLALFTVDLGRAAGHMLWVTFAIGAHLASSMHRHAVPDLDELASRIRKAPVSRQPVARPVEEHVNR